MNIVHFNHVGLIRVGLNQHKLIRTADIDKQAPQDLLYYVTSDAGYYLCKDSGKYECLNK